MGWALTPLFSNHSSQSSTQILKRKVHTFEVKTRSDLRLSIDLRKVGSGWTRSVFIDRTTSYRCIHVHVRYNEILCHKGETYSEGIYKISYATF